MDLQALQHKFVAFYEDASRIFEWGSAKKTRLVLYASGTMCAYLLLVCVFLYYFAKPLNIEELIRPQAIQTGIVLSALYLLLVGYLLKLGKQIIKSNRESEFYVLVGMLCYMLGNTILLYFLGFHSLLTGIYVSGSSTVGILLFGKRVILPVMYFSIMVGSILYAMSYVDIIAYSALVTNPGNNHTNIVWLNVVSSIAVPHVALFIFIANVSVNRWREREQHAKYLSETDVLTNIPNRRHFIDQLYRQYRIVKKHGGNFSLLMMDLDNFKTVNDTFGHHVGDQLLIATTESIKSCIRTKDILGRYGGEEFVLLLPNTEAPAALISAERCCERIAKQRFTISNEQCLSLQVSIGCVTTTPEILEHPPEHLLWLADEALLKAKATGKNRVVANNKINQSELSNHTFRIN